MLAAVLSDLDGSAAVFINRNSKDFDDPDIQSALAAKGCTFKWAFDAAIGHIRAKRPA